MRVFGRVLVGLIAAIALFFLFGFDGFFVAAQAEASAGGRPYCIGTAEPKNAETYLPVTKIEDLSFRHMFNSRGLTEEPGHVGEHHAVMELGEPLGFLNWSYRALAFVPEVINRRYFFREELAYLEPQLPCAPVKHFVKSLKLF
ncbi:hypothetical protein ELI30_27225 (plasmid) [Rhizobium leguminosarum]|uniref:hypothetical protein n=1 Tax=Rhizobium TaxID=379 RepID=UPI0010322128|nr:MULTISPECIES: hypothetical protein [Rhizobium]TAV45349.1 hypothetical protein ELI31_26145 [Rhizobium leguminosarum]TAV45907.1 hypothetical protein ELI32_27455 [Rhizobium leguminosarum]TAV63762.1 hypothetical protein ELI30_27225 [Rhizobium leguminosarum]TAX05614.1 hypothetical protein ELI07_25480 [Rhizobium leguminosarum]TAX87736.1 hypothetical protein ELH97_25230 [Rhizobium leguminosarum]